MTQDEVTKFGVPYPFLKVTPTFRGHYRHYQYPQYGYDYECSLLKSLSDCQNTIVVFFFSFFFPSSSVVFDCGCTDILRLNNGSIILSDSTTLNSVARFQCDSNFELFGDATRTCQLAGWSGSNPSCGTCFSNDNLYDSISTLT